MTSIFLGNLCTSDVPDINIILRQSCVVRYVCVYVPV